VLAGQITDLAGFGKGSITRRSFATHEGVNMSACGSAVAVAGDGVIVDVVH